MTDERDTTDDLWEARYHCRHCHELFSGDRGNPLQGGYARPDTVSHECQDGYLGVANLIGHRRVDPPPERREPTPSEVPS